MGRWIAAAAVLLLVGLGQVGGAVELKLTASDAAAGDLFGYSVGISANTAIVGAKYDDDLGDLSGSAYLFDVTTGGELFKLTATASDAAKFDEFGRSVAISGSTAIVGAFKSGDAGSYSGSAYVFVPDPNPIPEPSTFIIWSLLGALALTVGWRRRKA